MVATSSSVLNCNNLNNKNNNIKECNKRGSGSKDCNNKDDSNNDNDVDWKYCNLHHHYHYTAENNDFLLFLIGGNSTDHKIGSGFVSLDSTLIYSDGSNEMSFMSNQTGPGGKTIARFPSFQPTDSSPLLSTITLHSTKKLKIKPKEYTLSHFGFRDPFNIHSVRWKAAKKKEFDRSCAVTNDAGQMILYGGESASGMINLLVFNYEKNSKCKKLVKEIEKIKV